jgi:Tfp pilus assembly protein PilE
MRVTRTRDQSGAKGRRHRVAQRRKRGTTLIELVLYISIATVMMTFSIGLLREEQVRRERTALAAELQQVTTAAQTFVSANYVNIRDQLFTDTPAASDLIRAYGMNPVVAQGYLPAIFAQTGTTPKSFVGSLQYGLAVRAVLRSDPGYATGAFPVTQQRNIALTQPGSVPPTFRSDLIDNEFVVNPETGVVENDEIDLEALLVTISSDPCRIVPAAQGPRIVSQSESNAAGYVTGLGEEQEIPDTCSAEVQSNLAWGEIGADDTPLETPLMATGPYGGWRLPLEPYAGLALTAAEFPDVAGEVFDGELAVQAGRFVSLLALPNRPPLSESAKIAQQGDSVVRCAGVPPNSAAELACKQNDFMYAGLSFTAWDSNNDGENDTFPGLLNVNTLDMVPPSGIGPAQITDLLSLSCLAGPSPEGPGPSVETAPNRLTVDCPTTQMQGLVVTSTATVAQQLIVGPTPSTGPASAMSASAVAPAAGKIILDGETGEIILNGENLAEKFMTRLSHTFSGEDFLTVNKPDCPPTGFDKDIAVMPVTFNTTEDLRSIVTLIDPEELGDPDPDFWRVQLDVTSEQTGGGVGTQTETNPEGSKVVVLTGCKKTPPVG